MHDSFWVAAVVGDLSYLGSLIVMGPGRGIYTKGLCESRGTTQHQQVRAFFLLLLICKSLTFSEFQLPLRNKMM